MPFIEKIVFPENYLPFEKWTEIKFKDWMNQLLKAYLEINKKDITFADRIKINVVLWHNWWGKSRLFEYIINKYEDKKWILVE